MQELNQEAFEKLHSSDRSVVLFMTEWSEGSKKFLAEFKKLSKEHEEMGFGTLDSDGYDEIADDNEVMAVPTIIFFSEGVRCGRVDGIQGKDEFDKAYKESFPGD